MNFHKYPYTDFHELNLDWILDKIGHVDGAVVSSKENADIAKTSAESAQTSAENASTSEDTAHGWADAASDSAASAADSAAEVPAIVSGLQTQFNAAISALTVDDEVINARVSYAETEYDTLKERLDAEEAHDIKRVPFDGGTKLGSQTHNTICRVQASVTDAPIGTDLSTTYGWLLSVAVSANSAYQLLIYSSGGVVYQRFKTTSTWGVWRKVGENKILNILLIGNSEGQDNIAYVPIILEEILRDWSINVGCCYTGGADLADHVAWYDSEANYTVYNKWSVASHKWLRYSTSYNLKQILADANWNIVYVQSGTDAEGHITPDADITALNELIPRITAICPTAQIIYAYRWWAGLSSAGYYTELESATNITDSTAVSGIAWCGASLENGRTIPLLDAIGNHMIYTDNGHKCAGIPALLCAYELVLNIFDTMNINASLFDSAWIPTQADAVSSVANKLTHGDIDTIGGCSAETVLLAKQCAIMAHRKPTVITDCSNFVGTI